MEKLYKWRMEALDSSSLLLLVCGHHLLDLSYGFSGVQSLWERGERWGKNNIKYYHKLWCACGCRCAWTGYLRAGLGAVHNSVTAIEGERILQLWKTLLCEFVSRVNHPTIRLRDNRMLTHELPSLCRFRFNQWPLSGHVCSDTHLHQHCRTKVLVSVPPVAGAARTAAGAQDTFIQPILHRRKARKVFSFHASFSTGKLQWFNNKKKFYTSFCLSSTDCRYCSFPSLVSSFFFR